MNLCSLLTCPRQTLLINHDTLLVRILLAGRDQLEENGIYCTDTGVPQKAREGAAGGREALGSPGTLIGSPSPLFIYPLGVRMFAGIKVSGKVLGD